MYIQLVPLLAIMMGLINCLLLVKRRVLLVYLHRLGGPDPLDFINIYRNNGDKKRGIPQHWHYVTCGLSDLYGDGRVHE